jgi:hypothetical protein
MNFNSLNSYSHSVVDTEHNQAKIKIERFFPIFTCKDCFPIVVPPNPPGDQNLYKLEYAGSLIENSLLAMEENCF